MEKPELQQEADEATDPELVLDAESLQETDSGLDAIIDETQSVDASVENFTAPVTRIEHGHGLDKGEGEGLHDLRSRFNVRDEFIANHFYTMPNDHGALFELVYRKDEFMKADEPVFEDTTNTDLARWEQVESFVQSNRAPIPDSARRKLQSIIE